MAGQARRRGSDMVRAARLSSDLKSRLLAGCLSALLAATASAALAEPAGRVDVPAGSLDSVLASLAAQTQQQILYRAELVANRSAPAVKGVLTSEEALRLVLQGTGISVKRTGPNVLVLRGRFGQRCGRRRRGRPPFRR